MIRTTCSQKLKSYDVSNRARNEHLSVDSCLTLKAPVRDVKGASVYVQPTPLNKSAIERIIVPPPLYAASGYTTPNAALKPLYYGSEVNHDKSNLFISICMGYRALCALCQ